MKPLSRWAWVVFLILMLAPSLAATQQSYPNKMIRFILPYTAGGNTSILARLVGQKLTESWGQQVLIDYRPGGNTTIGTDALAKAPPDGYTILLTTATHTIVNPQFPTPYDPVKDFAPVATLTSSEKLMVVHPGLPASTLQEFIALAKSRPGQFNYASPGSGGVQHLAGELFNILAGVKMQHVPYKGGGPAINDLLGGHIQLSFQNSIAVIGHVKTGRLKALAVSGESRLTALPQVPTFAEAGLPGFDVNTWFGVLAPAGTPRAIVDMLSGEIRQALSAPDNVEKLSSQGMDPFISTPEQFAALIKADMAKYARIISTAHIKFEN